MVGAAPPAPRSANDAQRQSIWRRLTIYVTSSGAKVPLARHLDDPSVWPYFWTMPAASIKATYSLDPETIRSLERIARRWDVSKSEALRRAIRGAESADAGAGRGEALAALDELQERLSLDEKSAERWSRSIGAERKALSRRLEGSRRR